MKTRICFVLPKHWSAMMGGSQLQAKYILDVISTDERFDAFYVTMDWDRSFHPKGYKIIGVSNLILLGKRRILPECFSLYRILKKIRPDVIYQRVGCAYTGIVAFYCLKHHCRMIWHVSHDSDVLPMNKCRSIGFKSSYTDKLLLNFGLKKCPKIIVQTMQQAKYLKKYFHRNPGAIIPNFHPISSGKSKKNQMITVVWIANIKKWKQPEYFIQMAKISLAKNIKANFIMIGKPSQDRVWQKEIESKIEELDNLQYLGEMPIEKVNHILKKAHIFVNTSLAEGFANSAIQAWMRSVPVVSLCCSFDNALHREKIGFFAGNFKTLVEKVELLIRNDTLRQEMGIRARNYAQKVHSTKNIEKLQALFQD